MAARQFMSALPDGQITKMPSSVVARTEPTGRANARPMTGYAHSGIFAARVVARIAPSGGALRRPVGSIRATAPNFGISEITLAVRPKSVVYAHCLVPLEGRFAIVTNAGWDAVDADVPLTNGTEADGEGVWS